MSLNAGINVPAPEGMYDSFYNTLFSPEDIFEALEKKKVTDPEGARISEKIYEYRFFTQRDGRDLVVCDRFLGFWVDTQGYERTSADSKRMLKIARKQLGAMLNNKKLSAIFEGQWPNERILYEQLYSASCRYLDACRTDRSYNSMFFGMMPMRPGKLPDKMLADFIDFAVIFPIRCGLLEDYPVVGKAALNAWMDTMPKTWNQVWDRIINKIGEEAAEEARAILYK